MIKFYDIFFVVFVLHSVMFTCKTLIVHAENDKN